MTTRYQQLRQAVANLAASPGDQVTYLDQLFALLTGGGSAAGSGNDELALELDDLFHAANDMISHGELSQAEKDAIEPLALLLRELSCRKNANFWRREALFVDPQWVDVRICASAVLNRLPDGERAIGRSAR